MNGYWRAIRAFRGVAAALLASHIVLLVGAYFAIRGAVSGVAGYLSLGLVLVTIGVGIELGVLVGTARLVRSSPQSRATVSAPPAVPVKGPFGAEDLCWRCGWRGPRGHLNCPRCGAVPVRGVRGPPSRTVPPS